MSKMEKCLNCFAPMRGGFYCPPDESADVEKLRAELAEAVAGKNAAYGERDRLVAVLSKLFPSWLGRHPEDDVAWEKDWRWIVYIQTPAGQCSWHIHDSELEWFSHLPRSGDAWDGHSTEQKYERLTAFLAKHGGDK